MQLSPYVDALRTDLVAAAATGGPEVTRAAELLAAALDPAARIVLLDALSAAADEVTSALPKQSVEVRLRGRDPELVVIHAPEATPDPAASGEDEGTARVTLRLPETLKARVEQAAAREGASVNAWLVRAVARALDSAPKHAGRRLTGYARS